MRSIILLILIVLSSVLFGQALTEYDFEYLISEMKGEKMTLTEKTISLFTEINKIPRGSGNEKGLSDWLVELSKKLGWEVIQDEVLNVIIRVPGKKSHTNKEAVVLQGHLDMVCVKEDGSTHDFLTDPIVMYEEDGWLKARGTTLGADNGVAIAISLALALDDSIAHPPLELLFTVDEERGLVGANNLQSDVLTGKYLINVDSEDEGIFTIGCAGGINTYIEMPLIYEENKQKLETFEISISKLSGGHSGVQIHQQKPNAIQFMARTLNNILEFAGDFHLIDFEAGIAHNVIPTSAVVRFSADDFEQRHIEDMFIIFENEYRTFEPDMELSFKKIDVAEMFIKKDISENIIRLLMSLPHGVFSMSREMDDLVETSNNLAQIEMIRHEESAGEYATLLKITLSQRSSVSSKLVFLTQKIESIAKLAGANVSSGIGYPPWEPVWDSELLKKSILSYQNVFDKEPIIEVIHAGLECGVIGSKYPDMEMISIGPGIKDAHTTQERLNIADIDKIIRFLLELFENI